ncbi:MAG: chloramphenicol acetyltransferase [Flavobacterium sp.]|nr:chloramphenicol acetyltransferase [Flavobacterium sp.]
MKEIDITLWNRKEHYEFFSRMKSPFLGLTANVKCTKAYFDAKEQNHSFFASYLHKSMLTVNSIKEFKYRIIEDSVYELDTINAGTTIGRADKTFAFSYIEFDEDFTIFNSRLQNEILEVKNSTGLRINDDDVKIDLIRHTTIPWLSFNGILHPTNHNQLDSVPKISFGKIFEHEKEKYFPVSVEAHHGLLDGFQICEYFKLFEKALTE